MQLIKYNIKSINSYKLSTNYNLFLIEKKHILNKKNLTNLTFIHSNKYISNENSQTNVQHQNTNHQYATIN